MAFFSSIEILLVVIVVILLVGSMWLLLKKDKKVHKAVPIAMLVGAVILIGFQITGAVRLLSYGNKAAASISIIGGADGPTSVFIAGKLGIPDWWILIVGLLWLALGSYVIAKNKMPFVKLAEREEQKKADYYKKIGIGFLAVGVLWLVCGISNVSVPLILLMSLCIVLLTFVVARKVG